MTPAFRLLDINAGQCLQGIKHGHRAKGCGFACDEVQGEIALQDHAHHLVMFQMPSTLRTCRWCIDHSWLAAESMFMPSLSEGMTPCHARSDLEEATECQVSHQKGCIGYAANPNRQLQTPP